jgi:hypothetical protein
MSSLDDVEYSVDEIFNGIQTEIIMPILSKTERKKKAFEEKKRTATTQLDQQEEVTKRPKMDKRAKKEYERVKKKEAKVEIELSNTKLMETKEEEELNKTESEETEPKEMELETVESNSEPTEKQHVESSEETEPKEMELETVESNSEPTEKQHVESSETEPTTIDAPPTTRESEDESDDENQTSAPVKSKPQPKFYIDDILDDLDFVLTEPDLTKVVMDRLRDLKSKCDQMTWIRRRTLATKKRELSSYVHIYSVEIGNNYLLGFYNNSYKKPKDLKLMIHSDSDVETEKVEVELKPLLSFCVGFKSANHAKDAIRDIKCFPNFKSQFFTYKNTPKKYMYLHKNLFKKYHDRVLEYCKKEMYDVIKGMC